MKKLHLLFPILFILLTNSLFGQIEARGSMGLNFTVFPALKDYLNGNFAGPSKKVQDFNSVFEVGAEVGIPVGVNYKAGVELSYTTTSFNWSADDGAIGNYSLNYSQLNPSVIGYYVINGPGYRFSFGAGAGPRFLFFEEKLPFTTITDNYSSVGVGGLIKGEAATQLSDVAYVYLASDLRYDILGTPKRDGGIAMRSGTSDLSVNSFSLGVKIGILYLF